MDDDYVWFNESSFFIMIICGVSPNSIAQANESLCTKVQRSLGVCQFIARWKPYHSQVCNLVAPTLLDLETYTVIRVSSSHTVWLVAWFELWKHPRRYLKVFQWTAMPNSMCKADWIVYTTKYHAVSTNQSARHAGQFKSAPRTLSTTHHLIVIYQEPIIHQVLKATGSCLTCQDLMAPFVVLPEIHCPLICFKPLSEHIAYYQVEADRRWSDSSSITPSEDFFKRVIWVTRRKDTKWWNNLCLIHLIMVFGCSQIGFTKHGCSVYFYTSSAVTIRLWSSPRCSFYVASRSFVREKWLRWLHIHHFWQNDTWHIEKSSLANEWQ